MHVIFATLAVSGLAYGSWSDLPGSAGNIPGSTIAYHNGMSVQIIGQDPVDAEGTMAKIVSCGEGCAFGAAAGNTVIFDMEFSEFLSKVHGQTVDAWRVR